LGEPVQPALEVSGPARGHVPALDGVRGTAILLVLVSHLMLFNDHTGSRLSDSLAALRGLGWSGVDLFFALSGFLITGILYDTLNDPGYFRSFYMRRFLRIFPLYYGFLFLLIALGPWLHTAWHGRQYVLLAYMQNTTLWFPVSDFHPGKWADLEHFWSLAAEEQFYLFWPLMVFLVRKRARLLALALGLSAAALGLRIAMYMHGASPLTIMMLTPCRMDTLLLGGAAALALRGNAVWIPRRWLLPVAAACAAVLVTLALVHVHHDLRYAFFGATFGYSILAVGCVALLLTSITPGSVAHRMFDAAWLRSLGKYSYGMYVLHIFVSKVAGYWITRWLGASLRIALTPALHSRILAVLMEFLVNVLIVYAAAWLSYNLYEVHFLRLKRYIPYLRPAAPASVPAAAAQ
jgi:peptidoglycan/LPS O-acetylase OafA/YrhL